MIWLVAASAEPAWHTPPYVGGRAEAVGTGSRADALGTRAVPIATGSLKVDSIVVTVGGDFKQSKLTESTPGGSPTGGSSSGGSSGGSSGSSGGLSSGDAVSASSQDGIPCVY